MRSEKTGLSVPGGFAGAMALLAGIFDDLALAAAALAGSRSGHEAQRRLAALEGKTGESVFHNGSLTIDYGAGCAYMDEAVLKLTPTEYKLLCLLAKDVGKVLTHTYLTDKIWGSCWESDMASLRVHMATLRKKLEHAPDSPQYIQTHIGIGYRMLKIE